MPTTRAATPSLIYHRVAPGRKVMREQLFLTELPQIERITAWVAARRCLRGPDAEDFASVVKLRLIENDYEVLGKFQGRSSLRTYLTAVINRLYLDYQAQRFGKWRPSAEARRRGPLALRLEALLYRDGLSFQEACGVLSTERITESRDALFELSLALPPRGGRRPGLDPDARPAEPNHAPSPAEQAERQALARRTFSVLQRALLQLPPRDRIVLRMHVEDGRTVADVARLLGEEQKALYRSRDAAFRQLRRDLEAEGIRSHEVHELLSTLDWDAALTAGGAASTSCREEREGES